MISHMKWQPIKSTTQTQTRRRGAYDRLFGFVDKSFDGVVLVLFKCGKQQLHDLLFLQPSLLAFLFLPLVVLHLHTRRLIDSLGFNGIFITNMLYRAFDK